MGNKSRNTSGMKWAHKKDLVSARQVRTPVSWQGLASPTISPIASAVITGGHVIASLTKQTRVGRQLHHRMLMPVFFAGGTAVRQGNERVTPVINQQLQPWQRRAAKLAERAKDRKSVV